MNICANLYIMGCANKYCKQMEYKKVDSEAGEKQGMYTVLKYKCEALGDRERDAVYWTNWANEKKVYETIHIGYWN